MKVAILFPGQGAQHIGMGKELYENYTEAKEIFNKASEILDWDIKEVCFEDQNGLINQTRYTQAALFTTNYAIWNVLKAKGVEPDVLLGFSLGEYDAIAASGTLDFEETLKLVEKRATYMEDCAKENPGGMSAVIGLDIDKIYEVCKAVSQQVGEPVEVANDNCEGQVTIAGTKVALEEASLNLKESGARRVLPLKVSGAFHSSLMEMAADAMAREIQEVDFKEPVLPIVSNVTAQPMDQMILVENIPLQIKKGVRFRESIQYLISQGFDTFIEVGPKCTLSNLVKKMSSEVTILNVEDCASLESVLEKIGVKSC